MSVRVWAHFFFKHDKIFARSSACFGSNKFNAPYRCVERALNAFGARFRHANVYYMHMLVPILLDIASVTCKSVYEMCI